MIKDLIWTINLWHLLLLIIWNLPIVVFLQFGSNIQKEIEGFSGIDKGELQLHLASTTLYNVSI